MYMPNFLDGFDRLVAFDAETTGKRTPDAEFAYAGELVKLAPDVLVGASNSVTTAVQRRTRTIPIVFAGAGDVLESGLVKSVARPGSPPRVYPQG
jgi:ABC-type uncharacterized transport system substrate-binding protein